MYTNILVGLDGSPLSLRGLDHALNLAKAVGAKVTMVTVTEMWSAIDMANAVREGNPVQKYEAHEEAFAKVILDKAADRAAQAGVEFKTIHVPDEHPADRLVETAKAEGADLIVMSSHGRRGMRRLFLGSQTLEVVSHSTIPVLVIR